MLQQFIKCGCRSVGPRRDPHRTCTSRGSCALADKQRPACTVGSEFPDIKKPSINVVHVRRRPRLRREDYMPLLDALHNRPVQVRLYVMPAGRQPEAC